ncbi:unnamed protein product [Leuciscus chuanchicus]
MERKLSLSIHSSLTPIAWYFEDIITTEHKHGHRCSQQDFISKAVSCSEPKGEANSASFHSYSRVQFSQTSPREQETQAENNSPDGNGYEMMRLRDPVFKSMNRTLEHAT